MAYFNLDDSGDLQWNGQGTCNSQRLCSALGLITVGFYQYPKTEGEETAETERTGCVERIAQEDMRPSTQRSCSPWVPLSSLHFPAGAPHWPNPEKFC